MHSFKKQIDMGLTVEGGRLINERPDGMTGIQLAAKMKNARKRMDKIDMIAEGNEMARMRRDMRDMFKKQRKQFSQLFCFDQLLNRGSSF